MAAEERKLLRSPDRRWLGGVCAGLADVLGTSPGVVRACYAVLTVIGAVAPGVIVYLILWAALPQSPPRDGRG